MNRTLSSRKMQGNVTVQPSFSATCPHCAAAALRWCHCSAGRVLVEMCGKKGIYLCRLESTLWYDGWELGIWGLGWRSSWCFGSVLLWFPTWWSTLCCVVGHFTGVTAQGFWLVLWKYGFLPYHCSWEAISTLFFQCTSHGSLSPWLHHLSYQCISLFNRLGNALSSISYFPFL